MEGQEASGEPTRGQLGSGQRPAGPVDLIERIRLLFAEFPDPGWGPEAADRVLAGIMRRLEVRRRRRRLVRLGAMLGGLLLVSAGALAWCQGR
jgi:hypothetical protein